MTGRDITPDVVNGILTAVDMMIANLATLMTRQAAEHLGMNAKAFGQAARRTRASGVEFGCKHGGQWWYTREELEAWNSQRPGRGNYGVRRPMCLSAEYGPAPLWQQNGNHETQPRPVIWHGDPALSALITWPEIRRRYGVRTRSRTWRTWVTTGWAPPIVGELVSRGNPLLWERDEIEVFARLAGWRWKANNDATG